MQPKSPNPNFDFMYKEGSKPRRNLPLTNLPKPLKIVLGSLAAIILLIIVLSLFSGRKNANAQPFVTVLAQDQEILRITTLVQDKYQLQDGQAISVAATVNASLNSDKKQLLSYLTRLNSKISPAQLAVGIDRTTDATLQSASQTNGLDDAYITYLRSALDKYQADLKIAYKTAGVNGKKILSDAYDSTATMLSAPPLKS